MSINVQDVINDIDYDNMDLSELRFIISMFLKSHHRHSQRHIDVAEFNAFCKELDLFLLKFSN